MKKYRWDWWRLVKKDDYSKEQLLEHIDLLGEERERRAYRDRPLIEAALRYEEAFTRHQTLPEDALLRQWSRAIVDLEEAHEALIQAATVYVTENENLAKALKLPRGGGRNYSE